MDIINFLNFDDICISIFDKLLSIRNILEISILSKYHNKLIKNISWNNIQINIYNDKTLDYVLSNYNFVNFIIYRKCDINKFAMRLNKCKSLNIPETNITDGTIKIIASFGNCTKWNLSGTKTISDNCIQYFDGIPTLEFVNLHGTNINKDKKFFHWDITKFHRDIHNRMIKQPSHEELFSIESNYNGFDAPHMLIEYIDFFNDAYYQNKLSEETILVSNDDINIVKIGDSKSQLNGTHANGSLGIYLLVSLVAMYQDFKINNCLLSDTKYKGFGICTQKIISYNIDLENDKLILKIEIYRSCDIVRNIKINHPDNLNMINSKLIIGDKIYLENNIIDVPIYLNLINHISHRIDLIVEVIYDYPCIGDVPNKIEVCFDEIFLINEQRKQLHENELFIKPKH